jgi:hypothetical protein
VLLTDSAIWVARGLRTSDVEDNQILESVWCSEVLEMLCNCLEERVERHLVCWCLVWYDVGRRPRVKSVYESMSRTCDCGGSQDGKVSQNSLVSQRY